jgi:outer membrane protein assembly factor BamB
VVTAGDRLYAIGWVKGNDRVFCLDIEDGKAVWQQSYPCPQYGRFSVGDKGFYSGPTSTPTLDADSGLLFTMSADGDLCCWDTAKKGEQAWAVNLYERYPVGKRPDVGGGRRDYGYTTAPLVQGSELLVTVGGPVGLLIAFDKRTGRQRWASECKDFASHAGGISPLQVNDVRCVAVLSLDKLVLIRVDKGHEGQTLVTYPWKTHYANNLVTPTVVGQRILLSSGYNISKMVLLKVEDNAIRQIWESRRYSAVCSPVVWDGKVYTAYKRLRCLDLETGDLVWEGGSFGSDGSCLATGDGRLLVFGKGNLALVNTAAHSPTSYMELARRDGLCLAKEVWPHVVLANRRIYCKDRRGVIRCLIPDALIKSEAGDPP